jgi:hypothetical protein
MIRQISITYLEYDDDLPEAERQPPAYRVAIVEVEDTEDFDDDLPPDLLVRGVTFAQLNDLIGHRTRQLIQRAIRELKTI